MLTSSKNSVEFSFKKESKSVSRFIPVELRPHQIPHVKNLLDILIQKGSLVASDTSEPGLGKTFTGIHLAQTFQQNFKWNVAVIGPNTQCLNQTNGWKDLASKHGVNLSWTTTYSSLIGRKGKCSHEYLTSSSEDKTGYQSTEKFDKLCQGGLLLILDECHKATRNSRTHWACAALIRACYAEGATCRVLLISATPGDKEEHTIQLARLSGFIRSKTLVRYNPSSHEYIWEKYGLGELKTSALKFTKDPRLVESCWQYLRKGVAKKICKDIYQKCIVPRIAAAMIKPNIKAKLRAINSFLVTDEKSIETVNRGIAILTSSVRWNGDDAAEGRDWNMGGITIGLKMIELGKLKSIARFVRHKLQKEPKRKFVIAIGARNIEHQNILSKMIPIPGINFDTFRALYQSWKHGKVWSNVNKDIFRKIVNMVIGISTRYPTIMNGKTKNDDRIKILDLFQADTNTCNVLIISPGVGSEAISLHDIHGGRPRTMLISPDYSFTKMMQSSGRVYRVGVKSNAEVMMVYSKQGNLETAILHSMARKSKVAEKMLASNQKVIFPGQYPYWIEGEKNPALEEELLLMNKK